MTESILDSIKEFLGIGKDYEAFDQELILTINGCFTVLNQLNCGEEDFYITSSDEVWEDFIKDKKNIQGVKNFVCLKTKLMFDPPSNSFVVESYQKLIDEFVWRLNHQCEKFEQEELK